MELVYVIDEIKAQLDQNGLVGVSIENGFGGSGDQTFDHSFVLYRADGNVYRIESYVDLYCTRVVPDTNWMENVYRLLTVQPGLERLDIWNQVFSAQETQDTALSLDVVISTK